VLGSPGREAESGVWYGHDFRSFARLYLPDRFGTEYCLSAKDSIELHIGDPALPGQIVVNTKKQSGKVDLAVQVEHSRDPWLICRTLSMRSMVFAP